MTRRSAVPKSPQDGLTDAEHRIADRYVAEMEAAGTPVCIVCHQPATKRMRREADPANGYDSTWEMDHTYCDEHADVMRGVDWSYAPEFLDI